MNAREHTRQATETLSRTRVKPLAAVLLALALSGCGEPKPTSETAGLTVYNHTADYIHQYYINKTWGGNAWAYGGGGKFVCCIGYPTTWYPELSATVRWTTSTSIPNGPPGVTWHEAVVPIDRYEKLGNHLNVHFLPDHQVRLIISSMGARHRDYPGPPYPVKPADWPY